MKRYENNIHQEAVKLVDLLYITSDRQLLPTHIDSAIHLLNTTGVSIVKHCTDTKLNDQEIRLKLINQWTYYKALNEPFSRSVFEYPLYQDNEYKDALAYTLRNKLHKDTIDALMFVKVNTVALGMVNYDSNDTMINTDSEYTIVE